MINTIWAILLGGGIVVALISSALQGNMDPLRLLTEGAFDASKSAVTLAIGLIGLMALWLGIMKLAEEAGLVKLLARALRPVMTRLFPDVPSDHPAMGAMIMNIAANMLGLGNAATPLGLKAMMELQRLNPKGDTATDAMATFLAINASSVTIIPATVIGLRVSLGSQNPAEIIGTVLFATTCSTVVAITMAKLLSRWQVYRLGAAVEAVGTGGEGGS